MGKARKSSEEGKGILAIDPAEFIAAFNRIDPDPKRLSLYPPETIRFRLKEGDSPVTGFRKFKSVSEQIYPKSRSKAASLLVRMMALSFFLANEGKRWLRVKSDGNAEIDSEVYHAAATLPIDLDKSGFDVPAFEKEVKRLKKQRIEGRGRKTVKRRAPTPKRS